MNEMVYCWDCHRTIYIYRQVLPYSKQPKTKKGVINTYWRILEYPMPAHVPWPLDREYILYVYIYIYTYDYICTMYVHLSESVTIHIHMYIYIHIFVMLPMHPCTVL